MLLFTIPFGGLPLMMGHLSLVKMLYSLNAFGISNIHGWSLRSVRVGQAM